MTDTAPAATAAPAPAAPNLFSQIESTLEADAQIAVNWLKNANANIAALLTKVATGAEVFIADIEAGAQWVAAHVTLINGTLSGLSAVAASVGTNNPAVASQAQKMLADLQTATNDVAGVSQSLTTGNAASQPGAVTTAVAAINAVNQLAGLASQAAQALGNNVAASSSSTQTATPQSPPPTA